MSLPPSLYSFKYPIILISTRNECSSELPFHTAWCVVLFLQLVLAKTQDKAATSLTEVGWLGKKVPVRSERLRVSLVKLQLVEGELGRASEPGKKMEVYETLLMECQDAVQTLRDEITAETVCCCCCCCGLLLLFTVDTVCCCCCCGMLLFTADMVCCCCCCCGLLFLIQSVVVVDDDADGVTQGMCCCS